MYNNNNDKLIEKHNRLAELKDKIREIIIQIDLLKTNNEFTISTSEYNMLVLVQGILTTAFNLIEFKKE